MIRKLLLTTLITVTVTSVAAAETNLSPSSAASAYSGVEKTDEFDQLLKEAWQLYLDKKYDEALAKCAQAGKLRPADFQPHYISGAVYMATGKMKTASESFARAIELEPKEKDLYVSKSRADRLRNAKEEAVAAARAGIKVDAAYAEAYYALGDALSIGATSSHEIIEAYRTAVKLKPTLLDTYRLLGTRLYYAKDKKGAEEIFRKAMDIDPDRMAGRFDLGRMLVEDGHLKKARELWNGRTSDKDNTFPNFITLLERAEKKKASEDALAKNPNDPEAILQMGLMVMDGESWVVDGRQEKAIAYFKKALEIKPDFAKAQYAICQAWVQVADTFKANNKEVDEEIAKLRKMDPKLADDITAYRKSYSGGLRTGPPPPK